MTYNPLEERYDNMTYRRCGKSGIKLPEISLGLWHNFGSVDIFENFRKILRGIGSDSPGRQDTGVIILA